MKYRRFVPYVPYVVPEKNAIGNALLPEVEQANVPYVPYVPYENIRDTKQKDIPASVPLTPAAPNVQVLFCSQNAGNIGNSGNTLVVEVFPTVEKREHDREHDREHVVTAEEWQRIKQQYGADLPVDTRPPLPSELHHYGMSADDSWALWLELREQYQAARGVDRSGHYIVSI